MLLHHHYVVPSYTLRNSRIARWDRFSHPETLPEFSSGFPTIWWWDEAKAAKTGGASSSLTLGHRGSHTRPNLAHQGEVLPSDLDWIVPHEWSRTSPLMGEVARGWGHTCNV